MTDEVNVEVKKRGRKPGAKLSQETKDKMSLAKKKYWGAKKKSAEQIVKEHFESPTPWLKVLDKPE